MKPNPTASTSSSIVEILQARAASTPDRNAYQFLSYGNGADVALSYGELDAAAHAIAAHLRSCTVPGDRALLLYRPGLDFVQGFLGCLYAGVIAVPAYPPHPTRPARDLPKLRAIAGDARPAAILSSAAVLDACEPLFAEAADLGRIRRIATDTLPVAGRGGDIRVDPDHLAFLQYTSGSTGTPKGVMVSHANLMHNERAIATLFGADEDSTIVGWLPMYHDMGLIGTMLHGIYTGASCVLMSPMDFLEQPLRWLEAITRFRAHTSGGPNFAYDLCVRRVSEEQKANLDLSSWQIAFNGAEPVRAATLARFAEAFATSGFRSTAFFPCYGLAEATLAVSGGLKTDEPEVRRFDDSAPLVGCGTSVEEQRIVIVDPETREPRNDGQTGEIWVSGPSVAQGYWEKPEQTAETFGGHLAGTNEGPFLRTGDLGFLDNGALFVNGRRKDLIIIRGRNHYPSDIEVTVEQSHPALRPGCGVAFSVDIDGAERLVVVQEVDRQHRAQANDEVAEQVRRRLAEEHEVALHALVLIKTGYIPKTTSGKVQRSLTKQLFLERSLAPVAEWTWAAAEPSQESDTGVNTVAELAAGLLGRKAAELDPHAPLFALGFDSLQLLELKSTIERRCGVALQVAHLLNDTGLATLAAHVEAARNATPAAPIARTSGDQPLSNPQRRLWFVDQLAAGATYNETLAMRLNGPLDADALERAVNVLVERHEALRTTFPVVDGKPVQRRNESVRIALARHTRSDAQRLIADAAAKPFDLSRGPLLRAVLVTVAPEEHVFAVILHHIAGDGWSSSILLRELGAAYSGETLAPLPVQYADHAAWMRDRLKDGLLAEQLAYWRTALAGAPTTLALPLDRKRPAVRTTAGATLRFAVPRELENRLRQIARDENATLFMTLLAAFNLLLHRYSGQDDILVGTSVAGRNHADVEGLIGFFVNTVVLRGDLSGDPTFRELVARVRKTALGAYAHQEVPFEVLVDELKPERTLAQTPLFQAAFVMQKFEQAIRLGSVRGELMPIDSGTAKLDLSLSMDETPNGLTGALEYNTGLFDETTVVRMLADFERLLVFVAKEPSQPLSAMQLLTREEREQVRVRNEQRDQVRAQRERTPAPPADPMQQKLAQLSPEKRELLLRTLRNRKAEAGPAKIVARKRESDEVPASFAQQRLWFLWQLEPESVAYNMAGALRLHGTLDHEAMRRCLDEIVRRHETLRTTFRENAEHLPVQVIGPAGRGMAMQRISLAHLPEGEREAEAARLASVEGHTPFDLSTGPLFRATVIDLGPDDHAFLLTMHHVISDGWSVGLLIREIVALYDSELRGLPSPLPELEVQYADFSEWQRELLSGETLERYWKYWLDQLGPQFADSELPTDFPRPPHYTDRGAMKLAIIDRELTAKLKAFCLQERVTIFPLLLAGIQTVLHCQTGAEKVVIGTDVANRNRAETEPIIGFFVNQLVMQTDFSGNPTLRDAVRRAWETALGAYAHQDFPFDFLVKKLNPKRDPSRTPLFSVKFVLQNTPASQFSLADLTIGDLTYENETAKFDLLFSIQEGEGELKNAVMYKTDLFKATTIERLQRHLEFTLATFIAAPEMRLDAFRAGLLDHEREYQKARQNEFKEASRRKLKFNNPTKEKANTK